MEKHGVHESFSIIDHQVLTCALSMTKKVQKFVQFVLNLKIEWFANQS